MKKIEKELKAELVREEEEEEERERLAALELEASLLRETERA